MATVAEINAAISVAASNLQILQEKLRIVNGSLDNINPAYQMNQNYIAKLLAQRIDLEAQIATTQASIGALTAERSLLQRQPKAVTPVEDPYETARLAAAASSNNSPTESAVDVAPSSDEELAVLEAFQQDQRNELVETYGPDQVTGEDPFEAARLAAEATFDGSPTESAVAVDPYSDEELALLEQQQFINREELAQTYGPDQVGNADPALYPNGLPYDDDGNLNPGWTLDENGNPVYVGGDFVEPATAASAEASRTQALKNNAQLQNTLSNRVSQPASADWRVRLSLAQGADYLYQNANPGILAPLARTGGVVFPYTPTIEMAYQAKYDAVDLTHSNYRGYFYKNSSVDTISIRCTFTAQDTREAEYLLAVITFFRSVTKMFYGATDPLRGTPPPLVFLTGLGQYQFNKAPCVVSNFQYSLPNDVDYIRANGFNNYGVNLDNRRQQSSGPPGTGILGAISRVNRLLNNGLTNGAIPGTGTTSPVSQNNSNTNYTNSTYVPTKMEISISLLPIQTRKQVSTQFNVQDFASGKLLQQGFW